MFVILPLGVYADCQSDFKTIEKDFKINYKYNSDTDDFTITMENPDSMRYSWSFGNAEERKKMTTNINGKTVIYTINNYKKKDYEYKVISMYSECLYKIVKEGTLELKKYNPYADSESCKGNEDFVLCQKDYEKRVDEEEFKSRLEAYQKSKENNTGSSSNAPTSKTKNEENINMPNNIIEYVKEYIQEYTLEAIIIAVFIMVLLLSVIIFIIKAIKSRRLE